MSLHPENYTLYLGDCLDYMQTMEPGSVDAVITDPPYGIGESSVKNSSRSKVVSVKNSSRSKVVSVKNYGENSWDKKLKRKYIDALLQVSHNQIIFGGNYYANWLPASSGWIVWNKLNSGDFADCELVWTSLQRAVRKIDYLWNGMFKQFPEMRYHLTQKPLFVMTWIIERYTSIDDLIFDPFMGSGTTGVACVQLGRRFIGCEIDPNYFAIAEKRIKQAAAQMLLPLDMQA